MSEFWQGGHFGRLKLRRKGESAQQVSARDRVKEREEERTTERERESARRPKPSSGHSRPGA